MAAEQDFGPQTDVIKQEREHPLFTPMRNEFGQYLHGKNEVAIRVPLPVESCGVITADSGGGLCVEGEGDAEAVRGSAG